MAYFRGAASCPIWRTMQWYGIMHDDLHYANEDKKTGPRHPQTRTRRRENDTSNYLKPKNFAPEETPLMESHCAKSKARRVRNHMVAVRPGVGPGLVEAAGWGGATPRRWGLARGWGQPGGGSFPCEAGRVTLVTSTWPAFLMSIV